MKKIFLILALAASAQMATAQTGKIMQAAKQAVEEAKAVLENPKKAENATNWIKYGQALMSAYESPAGNFIVGMDESQRVLIQGKASPKSTTTVKVGNEDYKRLEFSAVSLYLNKAGQIAMIEKTREAVPNALGKALEAYVKAASLDPKGKKTKDITSAITKIADNYNEDATTAYYMGKYAKASELFGKAFEAKGTAPLSQVDSSALYNSGFTAWIGGNMEDAKAKLRKCVELGYFGKDGDVFSKLADIESKAGNPAGAKEILEEGFAKYPQSQGILVGLINYYVSTGDNPDKLFELIGQAKKNEPKNASLVYVEGQIYEKLGKNEEAIKAYENCTEVNPQYPYGYIGRGLIYWKEADKIAEVAQKEMDDNKYNAMLKDLQAKLEEALPSFVKAYEVSKDESLKSDIAKFVKDISFRLRNTDAKYMETYNKFNEIVGAQK